MDWLDSVDDYGRTRTEIQGFTPLPQGSTGSSPVPGAVDAHWYGRVMSSADEVGAERYILLASQKRDGSWVTTPVWIAALDDGTVGFTTEASSGKVKRIRNFPEVTLQPCTSRAAVADGAPLWRGDAEVLQGAEADRIIAAIKRKYRWQVTLIDVLGAARSFVKRQSSTTVAIVIRLA